MMAGLLSAFSNCSVAPQALSESDHAAAWQPALQGSDKLCCALLCVLGMPCAVAESMLCHLACTFKVTLQQPDKQVFTAAMHAVHWLQQMARRHLAPELC